MVRWLFVLALLWIGWRMLRHSLAAPPRAPRTEATGDPYRVLGVRRDASVEELTRAYRERMMEYHPDRVATLGPELRDLAHRKTVEIQRAWDTVRPKAADRDGGA